MWEKRKIEVLKPFASIINLFCDINIRINKFQNTNHKIIKKIIVAIGFIFTSVQLLAQTTDDYIEMTRTILHSEKKRLLPRPWH